MKILEGDQLVAAARAVATVAHFGQTDKAGERYILHPERVAQGMLTAEGQAAALLHDTIEDTSVTAEKLIAAGVPYSVVVAVIAVSHVDGENGEDYMTRIVEAGPLAIDVKLQDMRDNCDEQRLAKLDEKTQKRLRGKYTPRITELVSARVCKYPDAIARW